jgi:hypothetical protein
MMTSGKTLAVSGSAWPQAKGAYFTCHLSSRQCLGRLWLEDLAAGECG